MKKLFLLIALVGCGSKASDGACEWTWAESSADGSITKGTENCAPHWVKDKCNADGTGASAANVPTEKFIFTPGKTCEDRGYTACDKTRNIDFQKSCPKK